MRTIGYTLIAIGGIALVGCAATPPSQQLQAARQAHQTAIDEGARSQAPAALHDATTALRAAERAHADEPASYAEKHLAYLAERAALLTQARIEVVAAERELNRARAAFEQLEDRANQARLDAAKKELKAAKHKLGATEAELAAYKGSANRLEGKLENEREARERAEELAREAMKKLAETAQIEKKADETLISLRGGVLFEFGKAKLLPTAERVLTDVAAVIAGEAATTTIVIEGHTDSVGTDQANQQLSLARATAVRDFLVAHGVDASRIETVGRGESEPIASNDTPEGRANNRRVEIILRDQDDRRASR